MAATATLIERTSSLLLRESQASTDWEAPAGGPVALPRIGRLSFSYRGTDDEHLCGQGCLTLEALGPDNETCLVAFACGCRARVLRSNLEPR